MQHPAPGEAAVGARRSPGAGAAVGRGQEGRHTGRGSGGGGPGRVCRESCEYRHPACGDEGLPAGMRGRFGFGGWSVRRTGSNEVCVGGIAIRSDHSKSLELGPGGCAAARLTGRFWQGEMAQSVKRDRVRVGIASGSSAPGVLGAESHSAREREGLPAWHKPSCFPLLCYNLLFNVVTF